MCRITTNLISDIGEKNKKHVGLMTNVELTNSTLIFYLPHNRELCTPDGELYTPDLKFFSSCSK